MIASEEQQHLEPAHGVARRAWCVRIRGRAGACRFVCRRGARLEHGPDREFRRELEARRADRRQRPGRTLYALSPETAKHLLCKSNECLAVWPPLTVPSTKTKLKAGPGLKGHLGILHRNNGALQVTLRGVPCIASPATRAKGETNGEGIESFGGTWHAVPATTEASSPPPAPRPAPTMPTGTRPTATERGWHADL